MSFVPTETVPEQVLAYKVVGIYKDYDSNAPDTHSFVLVKDRPTAEEVSRILETCDDNGNVEYNGIIYENLMLPNCEGFEWSASYLIRDELVLSLDNVAMTPEQALKIINGEE